MFAFNLEFENKELEEQYKQQQQKYILKCGKQYTIVLTIGLCLFIIEYIMRCQYILCLITLLIILSLTIVILLLIKKKLSSELVLIYTYILYLGALGAQYINFLLEEEDQLNQSQLLVFLDITQQCVTLINFGHSPLQNSFFYLVFLISRIYLQVNRQYTIFSVTFAFYGLFFFIDQFYKAKQKRKLFLKGQRNKLLEKLIQEFIDEKICIIEKDEDNIKFVPIIINDKLKELSDDINLTIKSLEVCNLKQSLQNFLYKTMKNSETILCQFKNRVFQVKYSRYVMKKCQIFIQIKEVYQDQSSLVNYKELYIRQQQYLKMFSQQSYQAQQLSKQVKDHMFQFWFQKYYLAYKIKVELITILQLKQIFISNNFEIIKFDLDCQHFNTDKILFNLLIKSIKKFFIQKQVMLQYIDHGIKLDTYGVINHPIKDRQLKFLQKILFHIGFSKYTIMKTNKNSVLIRIQILNIKSDYIRYE